MTLIIEKDWVTSAGLRAIVIMSDLGHRCGYVGVTKSHPLHNVSVYTGHSALDDQAPEDVFDVHGGLTFSSNIEGSDSDLWFFGYDCAHSCDLPSPEYIAAQPDSLRSFYSRQYATHRTLEFCVTHCERLAKQIATVSIPAQPSTAAALDREALLPDGWRIVERATCYALLDGSTVIATLAGPDAKQNAEIIANILKSQPSQPSDSQAEVSDTEMLDWLISNDANVNDSYKQGNWNVYGLPFANVTLGHKTPREAIKAAIQADRGRT